MSIGLNVVVVACTVVLLVIVIPISIVNARRCQPYYSYDYHTYCVPYSYYTSYTCRYRSTTYAYCPY